MTFGTKKAKVKSLEGRNFHELNNCRGSDYTYFLPQQKFLSISQSMVHPGIMD